MTQARAAIGRAVRTAAVRSYSEYFEDGSKALFARRWRATARLGVAHLRLRHEAAAVAEAMASSFEKRRSSVVVASFRKDGASAARDAEFSSSSSATLGEEGVDEKNREGLKFPGTCLPEPHGCDRGEPGRRRGGGVSLEVRRRRALARRRRARGHRGVHPGRRRRRRRRAPRQRAAGVARLPVTYYKNDKNDENKNGGASSPDAPRRGRRGVRVLGRRARAAGDGRGDAPGAVGAGVGGGAARRRASRVGRDALCAALRARRRWRRTPGRRLTTRLRRRPRFRPLNSPEANDVVVEQRRLIIRDDHPNVAETFERTIRLPVAQRAARGVVVARVRASCPSGEPRRPLRAVGPGSPSRSRAATASGRRVEGIVGNDEKQRAASVVLLRLRVRADGRGERRGRRGRAHRRRAPKLDARVRRERRRGVRATRTPPSGEKSARGEPRRRFAKRTATTTARSTFD